MTHNHLGSNTNPTKQYISTEDLDLVIELVDSLQDLIDRLEQIRQYLDTHEDNLLRTELEVIQEDQIHLKTLHQWQELVGRVMGELDALAPPIG